MKSSARNISLAALDGIFGDDDSTECDAQGNVVEVSLARLHPFSNHPFKVFDDEAMNETVESIKKYGVINPAIVRVREDGEYELVSGHRRKRGCELAGLDTMPVIVRELDDEAATIVMVDSNLQRETLLPSERAFAYKMKLDAIKRQGNRSDLTSSQVDQKLKNKLSVEIIAEQTSASVKQVQRYIRLTELVTDLLIMVDARKLPFNPAVELSYLTTGEQFMLLDTIKQSGVPSLTQAQRLKRYSQEGKLSQDVIEVIMSEGKETVTKVTLKGERIQKYFPASTPREEIENVIIDLLEEWARNKGEQ